MVPCVSSARASRLRLGLSSRQCDSSGKALDHTSRPLAYILHFARRNRAHELGISWQIAQKSHVEALPRAVPCRVAFQYRAMPLGRRPSNSSDRTVEASPPLPATSPALKSFLSSPA